MHRAQGLAPYVFALLVLVIYVATFAHVRPLVQTIWANDTLMLADAGARIVEGKAPHTDYFSAIGVLTQAIVGLGLWWRDMAIEGVYDAAESAGVLAALAILWFARRARLPWALAAATSWITLEFVISLRPLGYPPSFISLSGLYNRFGWALLTALFLDVFAILENPVRRNAGLLAGTLLSLLLATKLNLAVAGAALLLPLALAPRDFLWRRTWRLLSSFVITTVLWMLAFRVNPIAFLSDQRIILAAMPTEKKIEALLDIVRVSYGDLSVAVIFFLAMLFVNRKSMTLKPLLTSTLFFLGTLAAALFAEVGSIARGEMLLVFLSPLVATSVTRTDRRPLFFAFSGLAIAAMSAITLLNNFESYLLRRAYLPVLADVDRFQRFETPRLRNLYFMTWEGQVGVEAMSRVARERKVEWSPAAMVFQANQGFDLLRPLLGGDQTLLNLFGDQAFAYITGAKHAKGDALFYHVGRVNSIPLPTDVEKVVERADWVLTPRELPVWGDLDVIKAYFPFVQANLRVKAENEYWKLWGR